MSETTYEASPKDMANAIRALSMDAVQKANSGHPGLPMGMADVATVLFTKIMKFDAANPDWFDRDRFILSAGHGSMLLYSALYLSGYPGVEMDDIKAFRQVGSITAGHPEYGHINGAEMTTGPLGQGLTTAVGFAIAEKMVAARHGDEICDHFTYVINGDGCLMEGISHEAIDMAGHMKLSKLIVLWDDNNITIDGEVGVASSTDQIKRFEAAGWHTARVDGHDAAAVEAALKQAQKSDKPSMIACKTEIGHGSPNRANTARAHGEPLGEEEIALTREALGWPHAPFVIPDDVLNSWRSAGKRGAEARTNWEQRAAKLSGTEMGALGDPINDDVMGQVKTAVLDVKKSISAEAPTMATRQSNAKVLEALVPIVPGIVGGSADLTGSNGCKTSQYVAVTPDDFAGNYMHYGVREFGMAAFMNGMSLHGGIVPYSGTFLVFADYSRPAIRLGALMGVRVIHVMTHDSIGVGEDGPTHQPVETIASLRAIPNLNVFRPADTVETAECWEIALSTDKTPSVMSMTRQGLSTVRTDHSDENLCAKGAYILRDTDGARDVTLMGTGSEVEIAVAAAKKLKSEGVNAVVVSVPCMELFAAQDADYRTKVLGSAPRIAVEAGIRQGWCAWLGDDGGFVGMKGFGASGPGAELYEHFGITADNVAAKAKAAIKRRSA
ncbi:MAG: transketolase [Hyphomicrobiaceae bacterium]|nr:transketolase [Hyphomicrobiaceae bacterium]